MGARPLKNAVYVLPNTEQSLEDFAWLRREIAAEGGEAAVCEAGFVDGMSDADVRAMMSGAGTRREALTKAVPHKRPPRGSTWVTRRGVGIDRIACAWLIRRFIDAKAKFRFVAARGCRPPIGEVRFDMYDGEYTHQGDRCTFEVLLARFELRDRGLRVLGEIVHDIDCKDEKFGHREASGVALVMDGIARASSDDRVRIDRGSAVLDSLHEQLRRG